ncbi:60S ribosomal protein L13 [Thelohanellus kitauei]|uniref:Large ribosomal subunit protein eL13 n=1 Tax=Thelohanellus kitauei TaxID=669202 RepID=A0A0C2M7P8_THEKT|nr:60S ribosomal protein L13 [Thelohanellus kitauei]KII63011.1 60S ribosomal protein L13 [Thelohanellus kitauei]KII64688.1 60S ribosomal protein L13 [Thelohanellus kitauei]
MRHNNALPNSYLRKHWQNRVKTWFDQASRKKRRRLARVAKAEKVFPRPSSGPLRPMVKCPTLKYNSKTRLGRGFTLQELKMASISKVVARTIGIAVDHRRTNRSAEAMELNVNRLKKYMANLVVFPKKISKPGPGDATQAEMALVAQHKGPIYPIQKVKAFASLVSAKEVDQSCNVFKILKKARGDIRNQTYRKRKAEAAATTA